MNKNQFVCALTAVREAGVPRGRLRARAARERGAACGALQTPRVRLAALRALRARVLRRHTRAPTFTQLRV